MTQAANVTAGTTAGIARHPAFQDVKQTGRQAGRQAWEHLICQGPQWDVLIIDEASKTLIQEFMVPALMAKRWIIVGDIHQLPPFSDDKEIRANLAGLVNQDQQLLLTAEHQRACLMAFRLTRESLRKSGARWLIVETEKVLDKLAEELDAREQSYFRIVPGEARTPHEISLRELKQGALRVCRLQVADRVLVARDLLDIAALYLPPELLNSADIQSATGQSGLKQTHPLFFRRATLERNRRLASPYNERGRKTLTHSDAEALEQEWLHSHQWDGEAKWRLTRHYELRHSEAQKERDRLGRALDRLLPAHEKLQSLVKDKIEEVRDIGLPSILAVLQEGVGENRANRPSALTQGMRKENLDAFTTRFVSLSYQHRMHPEISKLPRRIVYNEESLKDANTIAERDRLAKWDFTPFRARRERRIWLDVPARKGRNNHEANRAEIDQMMLILKDFQQWAKKRGKPHDRHGEPRCLGGRLLEFLCESDARHR